MIDHIKEPYQPGSIIVMEKFEVNDQWMVTNPRDYHKRKVCEWKGRGRRERNMYVLAHAHDAMMSDEVYRLEIDLIIILLDPQINNFKIKF